MRMIVSQLRKRKKKNDDTREHANNKVSGKGGVCK